MQVGKGASAWGLYTLWCAKARARNYVPHYYYLSLVGGRDPATSRLCVLIEGAFVPKTSQGEKHVRKLSMRLEKQAHGLQSYVAHYSK